MRNVPTRERRFAWPHRAWRLFAIHPLILATAAVLLPVATSRYGRCAANGRAPNIVLILTDDLGYGDTTCYNADSKIRTPNIDKLAARGIRLLDAHSPSAVCSPTRYGVLTGRYCWRSRLKRGVLGGYSLPLIERERPTVAGILRAAGYETACIGKWHLGVGWQTTDGAPVNRRRNNVAYDKPLTDGPNDHGFDYSFITAACSTVDAPYVFIENSRCTALPTARMVTKASISDFGSRAGAMAPGWKNEDVDPTYVKKAKAFISRHVEAHPQSPFFLYLALSSPHAPWLPPDFVKGTTDEGPRGDLVALADWCVGQIAGCLEEHNLADNTLLIFTSDNGPRIGANGHKSAGPFRGYKSHIWEGGHRVPFIARWPGKIEPGAVSKEPIVLTDMLATLTTAAGAKRPVGSGPDSYNVLPALLNGPREEPIREALVHHSVFGVFAIRKANWKLILETKTSGGWVRPSGKGPVPGAPGQLYDIEKDPYETADLWDDRPDVIRRLSELLEKYKNEGRSAPPPEQARRR